MPYLKTRLKSAGVVVPGVIGVVALAQPAITNKANMAMSIIMLVLFMSVVPYIRFRQVEVAAGVGQYFLFFRGGNIRVVVLEAAHLAAHVSPVAFVKIEQLQ